MLYLKQKFPRISDAKGIEGMLVGLEYYRRAFLKLVDLKMQPDTTFKVVATAFLGNLRAENLSHLLK